MRSPLLIGLSAACLLAVSSCQVADPATIPASKASNQPYPLSPLEARIRSACQGDLDKLCKGVTAGDGRLADCIDSREDYLSADCLIAWTTAKSNLSERSRKTWLAYQESCKDDIRKFCSEVVPGQGRVLDCLDKHEEDLSNSCQLFEVGLMKKLEDLLG